MAKATDVRPVSAALYYLPVQTRMPLKFGTETLTTVTCARVRMVVEDRSGRRAEGWGETPLSVQWAWPSELPYETRHAALKAFCQQLARAWASFPVTGHPIEIGHAFLSDELPRLLAEHNRNRSGEESMPWLAGLICCSPFDVALHDAYGHCHGLSSYDTYTREFMNAGLAAYLAPEENSSVSFADRYPADFLVFPRQEWLPAWHLVGGKDPIDPDERDGTEPIDGYPVLLTDWIDADGLKCLKIKLRGNDPQWDYQRIVRVGEIAIERSCHWLSADFNCTVTEPGYVNDILDRLLHEHPRIYAMILYVEQPFPYDLENHRIDVHSVSARKPLFLDESAHDWQLVRLGRRLGWSGVALKTCKTQTGALLTLCWAQAHGMTLMVQDLTNPMLAQIPHVLLAAHADTIMGVETNSMQFYPEASLVEAAVHPGLYKRRNGLIDLSTVRGSGFGYRVTEMNRPLPEPAAQY